MYINGSGRDYYEFYIQLNRCGTLGKNSLHEDSRKNPTVRKFSFTIVVAVVDRSKMIVEKLHVEHGYGSIQPTDWGRVRRALQSDVRVRIRFLEDSNVSISRRRVSSIGARMFVRRLTSFGFQSCNWEPGRVHVESSRMLHGDKERIWNVWYKSGW